MCTRARTHTRARTCTPCCAPAMLLQVDPIVASFSGGAVGVLSALLLVEVNNVKKQKKNR